MNSFLKAEWKTIVGIIVFGGAIFGWFYYQEWLKLQEPEVSYEYTCLRAGSGFRQFNLGTSYAENAAALTGYTKTNDAQLNLAQYTSPDGTTTLTFRNDKLAAIEFYPTPDVDAAACYNDFTEYSKKNKATNEPIRYDDRIDSRYTGLVRVQKVKSPLVSTDVKDETPEEIEEAGWIIIPNPPAT